MVTFLEFIIFVKGRRCDCSPLEPKNLAAPLLHTQKPSSPFTKEIYNLRIRNDDLHRKLQPRSNMAPEDCVDALSVLSR